MWIGMKNKTQTGSLARAYLLSTAKLPRACGYCRGYGGWTYTACEPCGGTGWAPDAYVGDHMRIASAP